MKKLTCILSATIILGFGVMPSLGGTHFDKDLNKKFKKLSDILTECHKITPGMTRAQLTNSFIAYSGGFIPSPAFHQHQTFFYRSYDLIKIDVDFTPSDSKVAQPTDIISKISDPYLVKSVLD